MARFFRDRNGSGASKREMVVPENGVSDLLPPFGELGIELSSSELRETAYEIFVAACRPLGGKPLTYVSQSERSGEKERSLSSSPLSLSSLSFSSSPSSSSPLYKPLTSTAASTVKKALGLKSLRKGSFKESPGRSPKKPMTVAELMRVQMKISEQKDGRIRRALLRIAAGQLGNRSESMVLPLEFLQQFKASDFSNAEEYEAWKARNLKILEAGLLLHPATPLEKNDSAAARLQQVLKGASERPIETGKNSESMQVLRSVVMPLACKQVDGFPSETCHWADGLPFNLVLYHMLLEACFDCQNDSTIIEELDEVIEEGRGRLAVLAGEVEKGLLSMRWMKEVGQQGDAGFGIQICKCYSFLSFHHVLVNIRGGVCSRSCCGVCCGSRRMSFLLSF